VTTVRAVHGWVTGLRCPYCPTVCQRPAGGGSEVDGLEAHVRVCHPGLYARWAALKGGGR